MKGSGVEFFRRAVGALLIGLVVAVSGFAQLIPDLVITNADVRTMDARNPRADTIVVAGGRIVAVGKKDSPAWTDGDRTVRIDAGGRLVLPGFDDAHVHFTAIGRQFFSLDLRPAATPAETLAKLEFYTRFLPAGRWILGGGWTAANLPSKEKIDAATRAHPVFLYDATGRNAFANALALKFARIDEATKDPPGGAIERDAAGTPSGILTGAAVGLVRRFAPLDQTDDTAALAETASSYAAAFGVTSVQDMSADDNAELYRRLLQTGKLKTRIYDCASLSEWAKTKRDRPKTDDPFVRQGCLKGIADGDADSTRGLSDEIAAADKAGWQVMVHAIGPRAVAQVLSVFEHVARTNDPRDRRFRVEHAHGFRPADLRRFGNSEIIASVQPALFADAAGRGLDPLRSLIDVKATLAFGSDATMIPIDPLAGIAAAVETNPPRQRLSVEEAVGLYTKGAAFAEFAENEKGVIAPGRFADLVILSDDIFSIPPARIRQTRVLATIVGGRVVYSAD
ncbi:MAG: amidohydrolase [Acidobacteria bacterium]|nr:amidohydrolase [Acidobacteriota bacterium]